MQYSPNKDRYYSKMSFRKCGQSGLKLPLLSLGLWHNFGWSDVFDNSRKLIHTAFDQGITHFDLANNYGPPPGSAESTFGKILGMDLAAHRDELIISTKAGYKMWDGPYGDWGSRKYLISSLDRSLARLKLDYVDIFYHHRPDDSTPIEETMETLAHIVKQGKALYIGLSNYKEEKFSEAVSMLNQSGIKCLIHQAKYSMFERWVENGLLDSLDANGTGCIAFSPLAQGLLTNKYIDGIPEGSRASIGAFLKPEHITDERLARIRKLNVLAAQRNQSLAQMALAWLLRNNTITSVLIGASRPEQVLDSVNCLDNLHFSDDELVAIEYILG